jgi:exodeoxyribonuclease VII large subunit
MACFNDERVVRAISDCSIPIVSGIGHQRDESLADLAADVYAHTPTAAAEIVVPLLSDVYAEHRERVSALMQIYSQHLGGVQEQLHRLRERLRRLQIGRQIHQERQAIAWMQHRLIHEATRQMQQATQHTQLLKQKLISLDPTAVLRRGYAVIRQADGTVARSTADLTLGQDLYVQFAQGQVKVTVSEISPPSTPSPSLEEAL